MHGYIKPRDGWWHRLSDSVAWTTQAADQLAKLSFNIQKVASFVAADASAMEALTIAVNEVFRTYSAVQNAIDEFANLKGVRGVKVRGLNAIARGRLAVEVQKGRGHCTAIGLAYFGPGGIRAALKGMPAPPKLDDFDVAFRTLSTADGDAFDAMTQVTQAMAVEAAAIANHVAAGQRAVALERLEADIAQLSTLEASLNRHMGALLSFAGQFGISVNSA